MFSTHVSDIVLVVIKPDHPRFGQLAACLSHDWREDGQLQAKFADGTMELFYDGEAGGAPRITEAWRFKREDQDLILKVLFRLHSVQGQLQKLATTVNDLTLPHDIRYMAKLEFDRVAVLPEWLQK
ncbi:MAG: hypothetical protein AAB608_01740 [Patescibacteria group bacterium]